MTTVLIVEDDDAIRNILTRLLQPEGYQVVLARNGRLGLNLIREVRPDLVISEVNMRELDGFELVQAVRADRHLAATSVMLLTTLADRASMRRGMTAGADDYLAKPFTAAELLDAVRALLKKKERIEQGIQWAVKLREEHLRRESEAGNAHPQNFGLEQPTGSSAATVLDATVLFSDIRNFTALAEKLSSSELAELLAEYFERICEPLLQSGGRHLKFMGDGLMSVFADSPGAASPLPAARRAIAAALGVALAAHEFRSWLDRRFGERGLPPFAVGVGLHAGEVTICRLGTLHNKEASAVGDTVNVAARLEAASKELGWTVVASSAVLERGGEGIQTGGMTSLDVRGKRVYVDVAEITGLVTSLEDERHGMRTFTERAAQVRHAVQFNSDITTLAVKGALQSRIPPGIHTAVGDRASACDPDP